MRIVMSSGHGKYVRGASGYLDEVNEARKVVEQTAKDLQRLGVEIITFNDDTSTTQSQNLNTIVNFHNSKKRDLDVSIHFNANVTTSKPMGTECLYVTQAELSKQVASALSQSGGFINRGPKKRTDLFFLNNTKEPAILVEVCFVDSSADTALYRTNFNAICGALAKTVAGPDVGPSPEPPIGELFSAIGKCSWFGGPADTGVSPSEGLAFIYKYEDAPHLFLPQQPPNTTGLARRLNPEVPYIACRWDYSKTPKSMLVDKNRKALVGARGQEIFAWPADWGPHEDTGRVADLSPGLMGMLGIETDDEVWVKYPVSEAVA